MLHYVAGAYLFMIKPCAENGAHYCLGTGNSYEKTHENPQRRRAFVRLSRWAILFLLLGIAPCAYASVLVPCGVVPVLDEPFKRFLFFAGGYVHALKI